MRKRTLARECVLKVLYQAEISQYSLDEIFPPFWEENPVPDDVRDFTEQIARGTHEHLSAIDKKIVQYTENWQLNRMAAVDRNVLRFSVYELLYMGDIPPKVTINEAVNMAKKYSQAEAGKFVNGILDKINHAEGPASTETKNVSESGT
jgi:transcription antitermination factor NusB